MSVLPATSYVEFRLLRYVVAVADELHFTRASTQLHLSTPSLSKQIRQLEQVLGYSLFERKTRSVTLTLAGVAFVAEARRALQHAQRAVEAGAAKASGSDVLRVGYTPLFDATLLPRIQESFSRAVDGKRTLHLQSMYSATQMDYVLTGRLHAGLVVLPLASDELHTDGLSHDQMVAAVRHDSPLAGRGVLGIPQIAPQPIIWFGKLTNPWLYQHFVECCQRAGFTPNIAYEVSTVTEMLDLVAAGVGISFVKDTLPCRLQPEGVVFRELAALELALEIGIAYRDEDCSESLLAFLQVLKQLWRASANGRSPAVKPSSG